MTPKEALKVIDKVHNYPCPYGIGGTAWMYIRTCIEKQIPQKVIEQTEDDREFIDYVCPCCKTTLQQKMKCAKRITIHKAKCCNECGQALDWSDSNAE